MPGKFEKCPPFAEYLWELVTHGGFGTDVIDPDFSERIYTHIQVEREDADLYPDLTVGEWYRLHEDDNGFVHCIKSGPPPIEGH